MKVTRCPNCQARFRVQLEQLSAHQGKVRCGRCSFVFNALQFLLEPGQAESTPEPAHATQANEPSAPPAVASEANARPAEHRPMFRQAADDLTMVDAAHVSQLETIKAKPRTEAKTESKIETKAGAETKADTQAEALPSTDSLLLTDDFLAPSVRPKSWWAWLALNSLLLLLALALAALWARQPLVEQVPELQPGLAQVCHWLHCSAPLPHQLEHLSLEGQEFERDPQHPQQLSLRAVLRNHSGVAQALPQLVLELTALDDEILIRKRLAPAAYLTQADQHLSSLPADSELMVRVRLEVQAQKVAGYHIYPTYPQ